MMCASVDVCHSPTFGANLGQQQMKLQHELLTGNSFFAGSDQQVE